MRKITLTQILMLALTLTGLTTMAQTNYLVDLNYNSGTATTGNWNNVNAPVYTPVVNIVSDAGVASAFTITVSNDFGGASDTGTTPSGSNPFPLTATDDFFYGSNSNPQGAFTISGLNVTKVYNFEIFAGRDAVADNRDTKFTLTGTNSSTASLNAATNTVNTALVNNISPDASGNIVLLVEKGAANTNSNGFFHINCFKMTEITPVAPQVLLTAEAGGIVDGEFLVVDVLKIHVMANGPGQSVADFEVVDNPSVAGINTSAKVVKFTRRTSGADAMPWGGFWTDVIADPNKPDMTVNKYVHVKILKQQSTPQKFKLEGGTTTPAYFELNSTNTYTTVGQWQDLVFYFSAATGVYQRVGLMPDFEDPLTAGADRIIYFDDIIINNDPTPITAGIQDNYLASRIAMFPNPAQNMLYVDTMDELNAVNIFTIEGRQVTAQNNLSVGMNQIDLSNLNAGVYFVKFTATNGATLTQKVIKK
jgi:hypothetical protein